MSITWTKCSDSLPDDEVAVLLAFDDGEVYAGFHDGDEWRYLDATPCDPSEVTHWCHLPPHPEDTCDI